MLLLQATVKRPQLLACLKVRDKRAAVAFWWKGDTLPPWDERCAAAGWATNAARRPASDGPDFDEVRRPGWRDARDFESLRRQQVAPLVLGSLLAPDEDEHV